MMYLCMSFVFFSLVKMRWMEDKDLRYKRSKGDQINTVVSRWNNFKDFDLNSKNDRKAVQCF